MSRPVALALRALGLGDFVTGVPALTLLRKALPEHDIVLVAPQALAQLVRLVPAVDSVLPRAELEPLTGYRRTVDVGVDLHGNGPPSRRLLLALSPRRVVGFADPVAGLGGPTWRRGEHEVSRWLRLVSEGFGLSCNASGLPSRCAVAGSMLMPADSAPNGCTIVHPGAAAPSRRWPADRFAAVAGELLRRGQRVLITGGPSEAQLVDRVCATSGAEPMVNLTLLQLTALVAGARLLICGDTGVAHLASAYRTPSIVLFGPVSPREWGPPDDPRHVVLFHGSGTGDPHGRGTDPALLDISVNEVMDAVATLARS